MLQDSNPCGSFGRRNLACIAFNTCNDAQDLQPARTLQLAIGYGRFAQQRPTQTHEAIHALLKRFAILCPKEIINIMKYVKMESNARKKAQPADPFPKAYPTLTAERTREVFEVCTYNHNTSRSHGHTTHKLHTKPPASYITAAAQRCSGQIGILRNGASISALKSLATKPNKATKH